MACCNGTRPKKKKKTPVDRPVFFKKRRMRAFLFFSKMAAKHLNSKWPLTFQFKMTDNVLFTAILHVSRVQNLQSMCFVKPNCLCMFFSIAFSLQQNANKHHRARFKSLGNTPTW